MELLQNLIDFDNLAKFYEIIVTVHKLNCIVGVVVRIWRWTDKLNHVFSLEFKKHALFWSQNCVWHQFKVSHRSNDVNNIQLLGKHLFAFVIVCDIFLWFEPKALKFD